MSGVLVAKDLASQHVAIAGVKTVLWTVQNCQ